MTTVYDRSDLALLCNERGIRVAAEIGTDLGVYACQFMEKFKGDFLLCVDSYEPYPQMPYDRTGEMMTACIALSRFHGRVKMIRARSPEAAHNRLLPDWLKIGFIYIDADHRYEPVKADIEAWWEVLNDGGILAGHDYDIRRGVKDAVDEFAGRHGLTVHLTRDHPQSWYVFKPDRT